MGRYRDRLAEQITIAALSDDIRPLDSCGHVVSWQRDLENGIDMKPMEIKGAAKREDRLAITEMEDVKRVDGVPFFDIKAFRGFLEDPGFFPLGKVGLRNAKTLGLGDRNIPVIPLGKVEQFLHGFLFHATIITKRCFNENKRRKNALTT